uniref:Uncharacterized protein n=1 Tax=Glossina austeni TaxID=7395 RepID=A0A1A9UQP1_GLOAU
MESEKSAPQKDIRPQGRTYPKNAVAITNNKIISPTNQVVVNKVGEDEGEDQGLTIFIAGLGANYEFDLKKIIALSTLRILSIGLTVSYSFRLVYYSITEMKDELC